MKKLLQSLVFLAVSCAAFGQGVIVAPQTAFKVVNGLTSPIANATITVCAGNTPGIPCSPALANAIFKDAALTIPLSNPFFADSVGNYQFAIAPGNYTITVTNTGFNGQSYQLTVATPISLAGGLGDPGANGVVFRNGLNTTRPAVSADVIALFSGSCSVSTFIRGDGSCAAASTLPTGVALGSALVSSGVSQPPVYQTKLILDARDAGMVCDDVTDDTTALNAALTTLFNGGGGTLMIPAGERCLANSAQIVIPLNSVLPEHQTLPIRITSSGNAFKMWGSISPPLNGWGALDLRFNAPNAKILTQGFGSLEIDHIALIDGGSDCAPFFLDTLTTANIHDVYFRGTGASTSACNDAIILGGTDSSVSNLVTSAFAGYGTTITHNFFSQIRTGVRFNSFVNAVQVTENTWGVDCGGLSNAAIESIGVASNTNTGDYIAGNLIEVLNYQYGIWLESFSNGFMIAGNLLFDTTGGHPTAGYRFETTDQFSMVIDSTNSASTKFSDATGTNTFITSEQSIASIIPQPWTWTNQITEKGGDSQTAYDIFNTVDNSESFWQIVSGTNAFVNLNFKPTGQASPSSVIKFIRQSGVGSETIDLGASGDGGVLLRSVSGADLRLESNGGSNVVFLCGGSANCKTNINAAGQIANTLSVGTAPLAISSNTPVATLSLSGVANTSQRSETAADTNVLTFAPPAVAGSYRIRFIMSVSAATAATLGWTATWTDSNGNAQAPTNLALYQAGTAAPALTFTTSSAGTYYGEMDVDVNSAAASIVVKLTFTGTSFAAKVSANIERLQ